MILNFHPKVAGLVRSRQSTDSGSVFNSAGDYLMALHLAIVSIVSSQRSRQTTCLDYANVPEGQLSELVKFPLKRLCLRYPWRRRFQ